MLMSITCDVLSSSLWRKVNSTTTETMADSGMNHKVQQLYQKDSTA